MQKKYWFILIVILVVIFIGGKFMFFSDYWNLNSCDDECKHRGYESGNCKLIVNVGDVSIGNCTVESLKDCDDERQYECYCKERRGRINPESFCDKENVEKVYICGNYVKVVSSLLGGGSTFYEENLEEVNCAVISPTYISEECKNLGKLDCSEIC